MAQRVCGALLLNLVYATTWLLITGIGAKEATPAPYLNSEAEVAKRVGKRAAQISPSAGNPGVPLISAIQSRPHPSIVVTVVIVALLAFLSASCIVRKYCFPQSNQTYTYSTLRRHEELNISEEAAICRQDRDGTDSNKGMLE